MCYAIPARITTIENDMATVDYGGIIKTINISLVQPIETNDYVLIHAGFAIEKLDRESALDALRTIQNFIQESEKGQNAKKTRTHR